MDADKLTLYLECPVCFVVPRNKFFACSNGHKICEACFADKLRPVSGAKQCPQGGCVYDNPPRRIRDLEAIIENSEVKLSCTQPQCKVKMSKSELVLHELKQCEFRKVPCPVTSCQAKIVLKYLATHLRMKHKILSCSEPLLHIQESPAVSDGANKEFPPFFWQTDDLSFYPQFVKRNCSWYFWMKVRSGSDIANLWRYSVKIKNVSTGIRLEFSGIVNPVDMTVEEVIEEGDCLQLTKQNVKKLMNVEGNITIFFKVFREDDEGLDALLDDIDGKLKKVGTKLSPVRRKRRSGADDYNKSVDEESNSEFEEGRKPRKTRVRVNAGGDEERKRRIRYLSPSDVSDDQNQLLGRKFRTDAIFSSDEENQVTRGKRLARSCNKVKVEYSNSEDSNPVKMSSSSDDE